MFIILDTLLIRNLGVLSCVILGWRVSPWGAVKRSGGATIIWRLWDWGWKLWFQDGAARVGRLVWAVGAGGLYSSPHEGSWSVLTARQLASSRAKPREHGGTCNVIYELASKGHPSSFCRFLLVTQASPIHGGWSNCINTWTPEARFLDAGCHSPQWLSCKGHSSQITHANSLACSMLIWTYSSHTIQKSTQTTIALELGLIEIKISNTF